MHENQEEQPPVNNGDENGMPSAALTGMEDLNGQLSKLGLGSIMKPRPFTYGQNFYQFCDRFIQFVNFTKTNTNLDLAFLSFVDNRTHAKLNNLKIDPEAKECPVKLCEAYKAAMYPDIDNGDILSQLLSIKQNQGESVDDFSYRLDLLAQKLQESDDDLIDKHKSTAFANGLINQSIKIELKKSANRPYLDSVNLAKRIEVIQPCTVDTTANIDLEIGRKISEINPFKNDNEIKESWPRGRSRSPYPSRENWRSNSRSYDQLKSRSNISKSRSSERPYNNNNRSYSRSPRRNYRTGQGLERQNRNHDTRSPGPASHDVRGKRVSFEKKACYKCGRLNHVMRNCWYKDKEPCIHCGRFNHISNNCRFKNQDENSSYDRRSKNFY